MPEKNQDTNSNKINSFIKGLNKDVYSSFIPEGTWTHARNAVNNTIEGDTATLSNEVSTLLCAESGKTLPGVSKHIIGLIHLFSDNWVIFTVSYNAAFSPIGHEIGLLTEDLCLYRIIVQDTCLNFNKYNLITGASRLKEDCSWGVYFADGLNPDRYLNVGDPQTWPDPNIYSWQGSGSTATINYYTNGFNLLLWPGVQWNEICNVTVGNCNICEPTNTLNCDAIRLARLVESPCLSVELAEEGGTLQNGSYYVQAAYSIKNNRVTNYFSPSNVQPIYSERDREGSLLIKITADITHFDEFELVIVRIIDEQVSIKQFGYFSTRITEIFIDQIPETLPAVPVLSLREQNPVYEKSDQITNINNYLLRIAPTSKYDFNYQPLANLIKTEWVSVEYNENYYTKGGSNSSYLRDEVYCFFIRWVYDTGDKSASYHIPGRAPINFTIPGTATSLDERALYSNSDSLPGDTKVFQTFNTATVTSTPNTLLPDGGIVKQIGNMSYWESSLTYPDNKNEIWNSTDNCWTGEIKPANPALLNPHDLCGQPIRHHKFPDNALSPHFKTTPGLSNVINVMGVQFSNIVYPKDQNGNNIPNVVGYEILRGTRKGNKSILAKGIINNFKDYNILGTAAGSGTKGLYANHPFNCIIPIGNTSAPGDNNYRYNDPFIKKVDNNFNKLNQDIPLELITFTSPDTSFRNPNLSVTELKLYGYLRGTAQTRFIEPDKHPKNKLVSNTALFYMAIAGIMSGILNLVGKKTINYPVGGYEGQYEWQQTITGTPGNLTAGTLVSGSLIASLSGAAGTSGSTGTSGTTMNTTNVALPTNTAAQAAVGTASGTLTGAYGAWYAAGGLVDVITPGDTLGLAFTAAGNSALAGGGQFEMLKYSKEVGPYEQLGPAMSIIGGATQFLHYFAEGADLALDIIYAALPYRQYALQLVAHGFYDLFVSPIITNPRRFRVEDGFYLFDSIQTVPEYLSPGNLPVRYNINNINRTKTVVLRSSSANTGNTFVGPNLLLSGATSLDQSLASLGALQDAGYNVDFDKKKGFEVNLNIASHYVGLKYRIRNQYGLINTIIQLPITDCEIKFIYSLLLTTNISSSCPYTVFHTAAPNSGLLFKGDTYITRFTEKNTMLFFDKWLHDVPRGTEFNYFLNPALPQPRYQMNTEKYDFTEIDFSRLVSYFTTPNFIGTGFLPQDFYNLDNKNYNRQNDDPGNYPPNFGTGIKESKFYLASSGVRDFFVESDVITDFRNPGTFDFERPYLPKKYTDLTFLFNIDPLRITKGNFYAYDYSLSINNMFNQFTTYSTVQETTYDPLIAKLCYVYKPNEIIYSLPQDLESSEDAWFLYLPLNRVLFKNTVNSVKGFAQTGMFVTFKNESPLVFQGSEQLQLGSGTAVTLGDGNLFNMSPQNVVISENSYEYGSAQNKYGVISTPAGLFYICQNQGKIFTYNGGLKEISQNGMKKWFDTFLPYKLIESFPDYIHQDNPVAGIGCQAIYDNRNSIIYFSKRDFNINPLYDNAGFIYDPVLDKFSYNTLPVELGQAPYFQDASWTISYDPKNDHWISFHDWHPNLTFASKNEFLSIKGNSMWKHATAINDYCNFYNKPYPFEVEFPVVNGQTVDVVRSVEYILECYKRSSFNLVDQFQVLDFNFDTAVVFNNEQVSGYLNLNIFPKNNVTLSLLYPKLNSSLNSFDILFSKEENKYKFNQFWDITNDRGEFPIGAGYPVQGTFIPNTTRLLGNYTEQIIWETGKNGYIKVLNPNNLNYFKTQTQRKKFRNYTNTIFLRKNPVTDLEERKVNMILTIFNTKNQISPR